MPELASLVLLAALAAPGIAVLGRAVPWLTPLERFAYGAVLGLVVGTLAYLPLATLLGFTAGLVWAVAVLGVAVAAAVGREGLRRVARGGADPRALAERIRQAVMDLRDRIDPIGYLVVGAFVVRWALLWTSAMTVEPDGLWAGHEYLWSDWPTHLGIVSAFAYGNNFPPEHILYAGLPLSYHHLSDLTPAAMVVLGMTPWDALSLHSFVLSVVVALALYAFVRRLSGSRAAASLALVLVFLGAGLGWVATAARVDASHDLLGTLLNAPWDRQAQDTLHIRFFNPYLAFLMSQRAYLYGMPLALLVVTLLIRAAARRSRRTFVAAGIVGGFLPLAHLPTLLALAMTTPFLVFLLAPRPWRLREIPWLDWILFHVVWVLVALPQLFAQLGGGAGALSAFRIELGWVAAPDPWWWFWLKNLGLFAPLLLIALVTPRVLPPRGRRAMVAFMPIFAIANVAVFQPWDWDNHKILIYWFVAVAILVAALLVRIWRRHGSLTVRFLLAGAVVTMILSPSLENLNQLEGHTEFRMLTTEQLTLAAEIRAVTPPRALMVTGMGHHDPVMMLTGRRLLMGYWGQLWVSGIPYQQRQREVQAILALGPGATDLMRHYGVGYVVIGADDVSQGGANLTGYEARYPVVARTAHYEVFDVRNP